MHLQPALSSIMCNVYTFCVFSFYVFYFLPKLYKHVNKLFKSNTLVLVIKLITTRVLLQYQRRGFWTRVVS